MTSYWWCAWQVAVQFWRAIGGADDEIGGLDSDEGE